MWGGEAQGGGSGAGPALGRTKCAAGGCMQSPHRATGPLRAPSHSSKLGAMQASSILKPHQLCPSKWKQPHVGQVGWATCVLCTRVDMVLPLQVPRVR